MLEEIKKQVYEQNMLLKAAGLVTLTWGNVSMIDREKGLIAIKPSGVSYKQMKIEDIVIVDLNGNIVEGNLKPSSDLATHLELYKSFPSIGGVVHTHSTFATSFAQAGKDIIAYGTTHADCFYGDVVCTRPLSKEEIENNYELNTGRVIVETIASDEKASQIPAVLVNNHGVFTWGSNAKKAVEAAITLEEVAKMAYISQCLNKSIKRVDQTLLDKHYFRKHGKDAYYGQK